MTQTNMAGSVTDDVNIINISDQDTDDSPLQIPQPTPLKSKKDNHVELVSTTTETKKGWNRIPTRSFRSFKSRSTGYEKSYAAKSRPITKS